MRRLLAFVCVVVFVDTMFYAAIVLLGLGLMVAASVAFAFGDSIVVLDVARFAQGVGGAASWAGALGWLIEAAPRERRGEMIGTSLGAAVAGSLFGPALGAAAGGVGQEPVFARGGVIGPPMMAWALRMPAPARGADARFRTLLAAIKDRRVAAGMWLTTLPGI